MSYGFLPPPIGYGLGAGYNPYAFGGGLSPFGYGGMGLGGGLANLGGMNQGQQSTGSPFLDALMSVVPGILQTVTYSAMMNQQTSQLLLAQQATAQWQSQNARTI